MRLFVVLSCFGAAAAAAAKASLDDTSIREAVTSWFNDRAAADTKYGHREGAVRGRGGHLPADL